jgi:hypothetical protein
MGHQYWVPANDMRGSPLCSEDLRFATRVKLGEQLRRGTILGLVIRILSLMNRGYDFELSLLFEVIDNSKRDTVSTIFCFLSE